MDANTAAISNLSSQLAALDRQRQVDFLDQFSSAIIERIEDVPMALTKDDQAYEMLRARLINDIESLFDLQRRDSE